MLHLRLLRRMRASWRCTRRGHGLANPWEGLMAVEAAQLDDFAVEREALRGELRFAESEAARVAVEHFAVIQQAHFDAVEPGSFQVPELDGAKIV